MELCPECGNAMDARPHHECPTCWALVQLTGGQPAPEAVKQAAREDGHITLWEYKEEPGIAGGSERTATLKLGGMDVLVQQTVSGFCSVTLSQENRDFCASRTFEEIVEVAPIYELAILAGALARLRRIVYGGLVNVEPMRDAEAPDPAVAEVDGCDVLRIGAIE